MRPLQILLVSLLSILSLSVNSQSDSDLERIKKEVSKVMKSENIPAISMAIITNGDHVNYINMGYHNRSSEQAVHEESLYQIASLGKAFVGIITHHLLLDQTIRLEDPITNYLKFNISTKRLKKLNQITIQDLLSHRSGFPQDAKDGYRRKDGTAYRYDYTLQNLQNDVNKLRIKSGKKYQYSNFGYALLAYICEQASGTTYQDLLQKYVTEPYHMTQTKLNISADESTQLVTPYRKDKRTKETQPWVMGRLAPPSAVYSSTVDLSKLMVAQLAAYRSYHLNKEVTSLVLTHNAKQKRDNSLISYGYGFNYWGFNTHGHTGDMDGYASDYSFNTQENTGIIILTSSGEDWIRPLILKINGILREKSK